MKQAPETVSLRWEDGCDPDDYSMEFTRSGTAGAIEYVRADLRAMERKILQWMGSGRVGASSRAMALASVGVPNDGSYPLDPADLNRCLLLLEAAPEIRDRMEKIASISPEWKALVDRWDELERCFVDEVGDPWPGAVAPKTYALMREILDMEVR